jgi:hypothetical protein
VVHMSKLKTLLLCGALSITPAVVHARAADRTEAPSDKVAPSAPTTTPAPLPAGEAASYAAREQAAPELQSFKGGASLSVTLGTTALVVIAVLVALLIIF